MKLERRCHRIGTTPQIRARPAMMTMRCGLAIGPQYSCGAPTALLCARTYAVSTAASAAENPSVGELPNAYPAPTWIATSDTRSGTSLNSSPPRRSRPSPHGDHAIEDIGDAAEDDRQRRYQETGPGKSILTSQSQR